MNLTDRLSTRALPARIRLAERRPPPLSGGQAHPLMAALAMASARRRGAFRKLTSIAVGGVAITTRTHADDDLFGGEELVHGVGDDGTPARSAGAFDAILPGPGGP